jgi:hypothetical protein
MKKYYSLFVGAVATFMLLTGCTGIKPGSAIILTAGYYHDSNNGNVPCLWEVNMRTDLPIPSNSGEANSVCFYQNNFYVTGYFYDFSAKKGIPCCWISKTQPNTAGIQWSRIDLDGGVNYGKATSIYISNNTIYIAGYHDGSPDTGTPCYWTIPSLGTGNPTRTDLPTITLNSKPAAGKATSIYVSGGTVYTVGYYYSGMGPALYFPCYWVGTNRNDLDLAEGRANSIYVSGNSIYIAGYCLAACSNGYTKGACYWTIAGDGSSKPSRTIVWDEDCSEIAEALSIYVSSGAVYTAGYYTNGPISLPCYWTNTNKTLLSSINGVATGIYVNGNTVYTAGYINVTPCYWKDITENDLNLPGVHGFSGEAHSIFGIPLSK